MNIIDKIWQSHVVKAENGFPDVLYIDRILLHEATSAQAFDELRRRNIQPQNKNKILATVDHNTPRMDRNNIKDPAATHKVEELRRNCKEFGIQLYDIDSGNQGIVPVIGPDLGFTWPGSTIICGDDSHASSHGAFGAIAFGVGTFEVTHALATSCILQEKPKTLKVEFTGTPSKYFTANDAILKLIATIGVGGASGYIIEYVGDYIKSLSMEGRMTLCNMSIEYAARAGLVAPDETTFNYLKKRKFAPQAHEWDKAVKYWQSLCSDKDAKYTKTITIDITSLANISGDE